MLRSCLRAKCHFNGVTVPVGEPLEMRSPVTLTKWIPAPRAPCLSKTVQAAGLLSTTLKQNLSALVYPELHCVAHIALVGV